MAERPPSPGPEPPAGIEGRAGEVWRRVVRMHPGLAGEERLRVYAEAVARYEDAATTLARTGLLVRGRGGSLAKNPLHDVIRDNVAMVRTLAFELGISGLAGSAAGIRDDVPVVLEDKQAYDPERHCGAPRHSDDKPGPRLSRGRIVIRAGGGKDEPCRRPKGWGTDHRGIEHCRYHAGSTPNHEAAAAREEITRAATAALEKMGVPIPADPAQALLEQVWEALGNVAFLRAQVQALQGVSSPSHSGDARAHVLVRMYDAERDRLARVCKLALDAGVAERDIARRERLSDAIVMVVTRVLDSLELPRERRDAAQLVAVSALRELDELDEVELTVGRERRN